MYHTLEGITRGPGGSAAISHSTKPCNSPQTENAYHVLIADDVKHSANQYQELPDREWLHSGGTDCRLDAASQHPACPCHVAHRNTEENQYHTLENDSELTSDHDPCADIPHCVTGSEHVYRTLELEGTTAEHDSDHSCQDTSMGTDTVCSCAFSSRHVVDSIRQSAVSDDEENDEENVQCAKRCATDENPYHVVEEEEIVDYQALGERKEDEHVYQTLDQVTGHGADNPVSEVTA